MKTTYPFSKKEAGAATFLIATILLVSISMIAIFAANYAMLQQKITNNYYRNQQAFEAAEAGLEYGINYLNQNSAAILANPVSGYIQPYSNSSTTNVALTNGTKFTVAYTNPIANNYTIIQITSTGTNNDSSGTRVVTQQVKRGSLLFILPQNPLSDIANVNMQNNSIISNLQGNITIKSGSNTNLSSSAQTILSTGTSSTPSFTGTDIQQNITALANKSTSDFFSSYFGIPTTTAQNKANFSYSNLGNYNSVLNGKTGSTIWIDQSSGNVNIDSSTHVGTSTLPVLLLINGNLTLSENAVINGFVVILGSGTSSTNDSSQINGGIISKGNINTKDNSSITYNSTILSTLQNVTNTYYAKIPGTWRDY